MSDDVFYDVFLSYNSADQAVVAQLATRLKERSLNVFFDRWELVPGEPWQEAIEAALGRSRSCAVVLGPVGEGPWQNEEMRMAIDERVQTSALRVIPLLLPGTRYPQTGSSSRLLRRFAWVDFRNGLHDESAFYRLVCGIKGIPPRPVSRDPAPEICPYMGLKAFQEEHSEFFFGREALSQRLVEELREERFLAVVGPSGSGKSSLVLAGLIPALKRGSLPGSDRWHYLTFRPGARPLEELSLRLARLLLLPPTQDGLDAVEHLENALRRTETTLHRTLRMALLNEAPDTRVFMVIDQFEEVFTLCNNLEERRAFIRNLLFSCESSSGLATMVMTLRADFYARAAAELDLASYLETRQVIVTPMSDGDLALAIQAPAKRVDLEFEGRLPETILGAVKDQPGGLPLLEHALFELWERRSEGRLTHDAYRAIGGVEGAVARRAEAEFNALSADQQLVARRVLLRLVEPGENSHDIRRRARHSELIADPRQSDAVEAVVGTLAAARLLTVDHDPTSGEDVIEVAHEALIHGWPRLRGWMEESRGVLRIGRRVGDSAHEWILLGRDESALLRGILLDRALEWARRPDSSISSLEKEYLAASLGLREREQAERLGHEWRLAHEAEARRRAEEQVGRIVAASDLESGALNRLLLDSVLSEREVLLLRACSRYLVQATAPFSQTYMEEAVASNPGIARKLADLFLERFDPTRAGAGSDAIREELGGLLAQVANLDEDRILRRFLNLIEATVRTNYFQAGPDGQPKGYLSIKIDSLAVEGLFPPRPFREIFVYSPRVEAIHLRAGKVARGGIRWSDRREDFRTEVLSLMKTQTVKNAVIVPVGSKGGFVVKRPPETGGREALRKEGIECYKIMIRGLLDLTDNLIGAQVVPPRDVVRRDDDDPYLVVATDKGTATFSDIANSISEEYGFWLGDAFASGGSAGYDHKAMAITSRGAWEGVLRHFRELDPPRDVGGEEFTCAGVGDMSGDVFGNGMLRSRFIRLVAAFDHRHIFVDPAPDPARSFDERLRLFELPRSSWADYDASLISPGGGVFTRTLREIPVSPEMAHLFGISVEHVTPSELIQAILRASVDLLFFGGIGTFVKASTESHGDARDRTNDAIRIDARELRAKVICEGANFALTQRARIEYAQFGGPYGTNGRLNTDFIDNSAGVDCSDHEVNTKILLNEIEREGHLTRDERDRLLETMTDEIGGLVLRDNYLQTQAISVAHALGYHILDRQARFMRTLEREGKIDRRLEVLPDEDELAERSRLRTGFTRPELAVLLAYAKIALYDELLASDLPDDPFLREDLKLYFPTRLRELYPDEIGHHRLRREIIATAVTNSIVNRTGAAFVHEVKEKTGAHGADIARAYVITREVFKLRTFWSNVEALDNVVPAASQALMLIEGERLIDRAITWFLREGRPLDIRSQIAAYTPGVQEVAEILDDLLSPSGRAQLGARIAGLTAKGVPEGLARQTASLALWLAPTLEIVRIARDPGLSPVRVGRFYFAVGDRFGLDNAREAAAKLSQEKALDKLAITVIADDLDRMQAQLTLRIVKSVRGQVDPGTAIAAWFDSRRPAVARAELLMAELRIVETPTLAMMVVANRTLRALIDD